MGNFGGGPNYPGATEEYIKMVKKKTSIWKPGKWDDLTFPERHKLTKAQIKSLTAEFADLKKWWETEGKSGQPKTVRGEAYVEGHTCAYTDLVYMLSERPAKRPAKESLKKSVVQK